jgi:hypothetical protein
MRHKAARQHLAQRLRQNYGLAVESSFKGVYQRIGMPRKASDKHKGSLCSARREFYII